MPKIIPMTMVVRKVMAMICQLMKGAKGVTTERRKASR